MSHLRPNQLEFQLELHSAHEFWISKQLGIVPPELT